MSTLDIFRRRVDPPSRFCCDNRCHDGTCPQFQPTEPARRSHSPAIAALAIALIAGGTLLLIGADRIEPAAFALVGESR